jgi:hypothetical protein
MAKFVQQQQMNQQRMAAQQQSASAGGQMTTADLIKLLSSNGVYKGKSQNDIMKAIQALMASQQG